MLTGKLARTGKARTLDQTKGRPGSMSCSVHSSGLQRARVVIETENVDQVKVRGTCGPWQDKRRISKKDGHQNRGSKRRAKLSNAKAAQEKQEGRAGGSLKMVDGALRLPRLTKRFVGKYNMA